MISLPAKAKWKLHLVQMTRQNQKSLTTHNLKKTNQAAKTVEVDLATHVH